MNVDPKAVNSKDFPLVFTSQCFPYSLDMFLELLSCVQPQKLIVYIEAELVLNMIKNGKLGLFLSLIYLRTQSPFVTFATTHFGNRQ